MTRSTTRTTITRRLVIGAIATTCTLGLAAPASAAETTPGWKCAVAVPAAEALVSATKLTLQVATREVPKAETRLAAARFALVKAQAAADATTRAAAAEPGNAALAEAAKTTQSTANARKAAVRSAESLLKAAKAGLPRATAAVTKAQAKLASLKNSCK